jgi:hypothetical protein
MSQYFNIKGLKVRVSDHEPNFSMDKLRGRNDIELYTTDAAGKALDLMPQIEKACEKHDLQLSDFNEVLGKKQRVNVMQKHYAIVDAWFANPAENAELLSSLKNRPSLFTPVGLTKKQQALFVDYVNSKS